MHDSIIIVTTKSNLRGDKIYLLFILILPKLTCVFADLLSALFVDKDVIYKEGDVAVQGRKQSTPADNKPKSLSIVPAPSSRSKSKSGRKKRSKKE